MRVTLVSTVAPSRCVGLLVVLTGALATTATTRWLGADGAAWYASPSFWSGGAFPRYPTHIEIPGSVVLHRTAPHAASAIVLDAKATFDLEEDAVLVLGESDLGCAPGSYHDMYDAARFDQCVPCPVGMHQPLKGQTSCVACAAGTIAATPGLVACEACAVGTYQAIEGKTSCAACAAGRFAEHTGAAGCDACAAGRYASAGASTCVECAAGTNQTATAAAACEPCPAGTHAASTGTTLCSDCASGRFQPSAGRDACEACDYTCPAGTFHAGCGLVHAGSCVACEPGHFKSAESAQGCTPCATGRFQPESGKLRCGACEPGRFADRTAQTACAACDYHCPKGQQHTGCAGGSSGACAPCAAGRVKGAGSHPCEACAAGRFHGSEGQVECKDCSAGQYAEVTGHAKCSSCDYFCPAGLEHHGCGGEHRGTCEKCRPGTFKPTEGSAGCADCVAGQFTSLAGSTKCVGCPPRTFQPSAGKDACTACDYTCPAGQHHTTCGGTDAGACSACSPGHFKSTATPQAESCLPCPAGTFQPEAGKAKCEPWKVCGVGFGLHQEGTALQDRVCKVCKQGETYSPAASGAACLKKSDGECPAGEWENSPVTLSSDRTCASWSLCPVGFGLVAEGNSRSDRECAVCELGASFSPEASAGACQAVRAPCPDGEYTDVEPTLSSDRICEPCKSDKPGAANEVCAAWNKKINDFLSAKFDAAVAKVTEAGREPIRLKLLELKSATVPCKHIKCRHEGGLIVVKHDKRESKGGVWNHEVKLESKGFHHCMWVHGRTHGSHSSSSLAGTCQCLCHSEVPVLDDPGAKKFFADNRAQRQKSDAKAKLESCRATADTAEMARSRRISGEPRCPIEPYVPGKTAINGGWSAWTSWSLCYKNQMERERTCDSPVPKNGGHHCEGPDLQVGSCGHHFA